MRVRVWAQKKLKRMHAQSMPTAEATLDVQAASIFRANVHGPAIKEGLKPPKLR